MDSGRFADGCCEADTAMLFGRVLTGLANVRRRGGSYSCGCSRPYASTGVKGTDGLMGDA